ncbi:unnamed protein product [Brassica oleracea var. botrytis]|uniref:(rape) hypothetical protein n=1 Tax=Brassica napus TaxID=3708 RepID=A0A816IDI0_BRANA|nr:unnamed protein product [Brassica napus]
MSVRISLFSCSDIRGTIVPFVPLLSRPCLKRGSSLVCYLGVPLKQSYGSKVTNHCWIISNRFSNWTIKYMSFAGRLQLVRSVIYSTVMFWTSIFLLPNRCMWKMEKMYSGFLWRQCIYLGKRGINASIMLAASIIAEIQFLLRAKLDSFSHSQQNLLSTVTFLST